MLQYLEHYETKGVPTYPECQLAPVSPILYVVLSTMQTHYHNGLVFILTIH